VTQEPSRSCRGAGSTIGRATAIRLSADGRRSGGALPIDLRHRFLDVVELVRHEVAVGGALLSSKSRDCPFAGA
jgi:hypothetical protein